MPGWHAATREVEQAGRLKVFGITEEQHGDRTALFLQWHGIDWPVLLDSYNLLGVSAVPFTFFIDEYGIIRDRNPKPADLGAFLAARFPAPSPAIERPRIPLPFPRAVLAEEAARIDETVGTLKFRSDIDPASPVWAFRIGVLLRKRHDLADFRRPDDFADAVAHWTKALASEPSQYIWRRRIQQYGPRLDKPYPFYDWVPEARAAITARGERPVPLAVEPTGAEIARPADDRATDSVETPASSDATPHPDPEGRLERDDGTLLLVSSAAVRSTERSRPGWRIHLTFTPNSDSGAHWNNESGPAEFRANPSSAPGWSVTPSVVPVTGSDPRPPATGSEPRSIEIELAADDPAESSPAPEAISGSLFFHACEGPSGVCRFLRRDIRVQLLPREDVPEGR